MFRKKLFRCLSFFIIIATAYILMVFLLPAYAIDSTRLYDMGRSYGTFLAGTDRGYETNVISASAYYDKSSSQGIERVRAWGRLDNITKIYSPPNYFCYIAGCNIRLYSDDSRRNYLFINGINPPDSSSSTNLPLVIYDILNYRGIPTNIIAAYVNNFFASGISTSGFGSYDVIRTYNGTTSDKINLPSTISYSDADGQLKNQTNGSSAESYFGYSLNNQNTNFYLWPQIKIQYGIQYQGSFPAYMWTNYAGVRHKVNT